MDLMMDKMWTDMATVFNGGQLATAKTLHFERFFPHSGRRPVSAEIWEEDNGQYHYVETEEPLNGKGSTNESMPSRFRNMLMPDSQKTTN
jgi:hypothetical protein